MDRNHPLRSQYKIEVQTTLTLTGNMSQFDNAPSFTEPSAAEPVPSEAEAEPEPEPEPVPDPRQRSYVEVCIDRSGSMQSMGKIPRKQTAELFASQKRIAQEKKLDIRMSFTSFDDIATTFIDNTPALEVPEPDEDTLATWLKPRNTTLLIDTILARIAVLRTRVKDYKATLPEGDRDTLVTSTLYVLTDGQDNQSVHSSQQLNKAMTEARQDKMINHTIFLAANQDAISSANAFGFNTDTSMTIGASPEDACRGMRSASEMMSRVTTSATKRAVFSDSDREGAVRQASAPHTLQRTPPKNEKKAFVPPPGGFPPSMHKKLTKAERRELQDKQRAAKAAVTPAPKPGGSEASLAPQQIKHTPSIREGPEPLSKTP
jgi:hypothetical protein